MAVRTKFNNRVTPAMAAGLVDRPATQEQLVELIDERPRRSGTPGPTENAGRRHSPRTQAVGSVSLFSVSG